MLATLSNVVGVLSQIVLWNLFAGQEVKRWQSARISDMHSRLLLKALRKDGPEQAAGIAPWTFASRPFGFSEGRISLSMHLVEPSMRQIAMHETEDSVSLWRRSG